MSWGSAYNRVGYKGWWWDQDAGVINYLNSLPTSVRATLDSNSRLRGGLLDLTTRGGAGFLDSDD